MKHPPSPIELSLYQYALVVGTMWNLAYFALDDVFRWEGYIPDVNNTETYRMNASVFSIFFHLSWLILINKSFVSQFC